MGIKKMLNSLQRVTSSNTFIPEIDGLRFIAIISVILYHINGFLSAKNHHIYNKGTTKDIISNILERGHLGVELFFVISGFILSYPFAAHYINQKQKPNIKKYFIRRLTRLEPPYILSMIGLFLAAIFLGKYSINELIPSLLASLSYTHNIFYPGQMPIINSVAWSLEIEIQFYLIAPLLASVFRLSTQKRRYILVVSIILFQYLNTSIPQYLQYLQSLIISNTLE